MREGTLVRPIGASNGSPNLIIVNMYDDGTALVIFEKPPNETPYLIHARLLMLVDKK